jgi:acyl carrier protein
LSDYIAVVLSLLQKWGDVPTGSIRPEHRLLDDLHLDGDDYGMSLVPAIEKQLGIKPKMTEWENLVTVADLLAVVECHLAHKRGSTQEASA